MGSWELLSAVRNHTPWLGLCGLLTAKLSLQPQRRMFIVTNHCKEYILVLPVLSEQGIPIYLTASTMITYRSKSKTLEIARKMSFSNSSGLPTFLGIWRGKGTPVLFLQLFHLCQTFLLVSCFFSSAYELLHWPLMRSISVYSMGKCIYLLPVFSSRAFLYDLGFFRLLCSLVGRGPVTGKPVVQTNSLKEFC